MVEYLYKRPKRHKTAYLIIIIAIITVLLFLAYSQTIDLSFLGPLGREQCSEKISKLCSDCFMASRLNIEPSEILENQGSIGNDVIECSNLYFDSNWTEGQSCKSYLDFCYRFLSE